MIIGICGFIGSGKDTAADFLVNFHEFRRESFANSLKDAVSYVFGWDRTLLEGRTKSARAWREEVDQWWATRLNMPQLTPRWILQYWGTEVCRKSFHDEVWIASLENKLRNIQDNIVISDCRFPNEIHAIKAQGGKVFWVQRGAHPAWFTNGVAASYGNNWALEFMKMQQIHSSEWAWLNTKFDGIIDNNSSIDSLHKQIIDLGLNPLAATSSLPDVVLADSSRRLF